MKFFNLFLIILVVFLRTGNVLSDTNIFDVNNIEIEKKGKNSNEALANQAIKKGFRELITKILLKNDLSKLQELKFSEIKELVTYYQVSNKNNEKNDIEKVNFNISFDKDKMHDLFFKKSISYSEIINKELFILPILKKENKIYIYSQNFFYNKWNEIYKSELIEFILPLENIEIIQSINTNQDNLLNLALILIEDNNSKTENIYFKTKILGKNIVKNIKIKRLNLNQEEFYKKIIIEVKQEIINLIKLQNLIDITTPSFLNAQFKINKKSNLVELNSRLNQIDLIENLYIEKFNNEVVFLKIKYLGKLDQIIKQLENQKILLKLVGEQWSIKII